MTWCSAPASYKRGYDATVFRPKVDAGLGWLKGGEEGTPQICRTYYLNIPDTEKIAARARDMRDRAGVLSGYALGEIDHSEARDVLADTLAVFGDDPGLHWDTLADRLAERWPDRYADLTGEAVSRAAAQPRRSLGHGEHRRGQSPRLPPGRCRAGISAVSRYRGSAAATAPRPAETPSAATAAIRRTVLTCAVAGSAPARGGRENRSGGTFRPSGAGRYRYRGPP